ncbi:14132_t:CDS:2, partial [Gigaspora margarita]
FIQSSQLSQSYSGKTVVPLTSDLSHEEKLPKNFDGSSQSSQSYSGSTLVLSTSDLS